VGTAIHSAAPRHLIGVHLGGASALSDYDQFQGKSWLNFQAFQSGHASGICEAGLTNDYAKFTCRARDFALRFRCVGETSTAIPVCANAGAPAGQPKKPAVNTEGKYETPGDNETRVQCRHVAWISGLSGSFGHNTGVWPDIAAWTNPTAYLSPDHHSDEDLGRLKGLFRSMPWSDLVPRHDLLVEQNNFSGNQCTANGVTAKADWLQLWKPHLALDVANGYGLAYLPRPTRCAFPSPPSPPPPGPPIYYNPSTSIVLNRAKANALGISCATWAGRWISPEITGIATSFISVDAICMDSGSGPVSFTVPQGKITCNELCDRVLKLTKKTSAAQNSPNIVASSSTADLDTGIELSEDGQTSTITGQVSRNGLPMGDPILLSGSDLLFRKLPSAALDASGNFLVVWEEENATGTDDIVAARFNSSMEPIVPPFLLNDTTDGQQAEPWVSGDASGDTVAVWTNYSQDDEIAGDIYGKVLDSSGQPAGSEFLISTDNQGNQSMPQVQMDGDGGFVVAWTREPPGDTLDVIPPGDGDPTTVSAEASAGARQEKKSGVYYRVFGANGRARGPERRVDSGNSGRDRLSRLEVHRHGGFKIHWRAFDAAGRDQGEREQEHDQDGNPSGSH
jgi:hypothetical protein